MSDSKNLREAIEALKKFGAMIMPTVGYKDKTWWVEDNGIWGLKEHIPWGLYFNDDEIVELAEEYAGFKSTEKTTV